MSLPEFLFERVTADIGQQMDGVLALTEQLERQPLTPDAEACVAAVAEAAAGVRRLIAAAADLSAAQQLTFTPAPLALRTLMDAVQTRWRDRACEAGVTLLASYDGPPDAQAKVDEARLLQVYDGLLAEALAGGAATVEVSLRAMPGAGALQLEGRVRGGVDIWPADAAPEERIGRLADGFGLEVALGALLAQQIVTGLEGALRAESRPGGAEQVFRITVPAAHDVGLAPPERPARTAHVLVVDDNATNRIVAQALCEMHGCTCETAEDGLDAVRLAADARFDLVLMDIRMPGLDGVGATRQIRAMPGQAGRVPIVALTANADREDVAAYLAAGMDGVIEKPMKPAELLETLRRAVRVRPSVAA